MNKFTWSTSQSTTFICQRKWLETPTTVTIELVAENADNNVCYQFIPGQFTTLGIEIDGVMEYRAYSISSTPEQPYLQLTIKRVLDGKVSNYIVDHLAQGQKVQLLKPAGEFHINQPYCDQVVLLSAGCGITPVMSMARKLLSEPNDDTDIHFIHAATCAEQLIYHQELLDMATRYSRFHLNIMLEDASGTHYSQGMLNSAYLQQFCPDIAARSAFLCGPVAFMDAMKTCLCELGMDMSHFYQESFTPAESTQPVPLQAEMALDDQTKQGQALKQANIFVPAFAAQVEAKVGSMLIDALEQAKVPVIAACRSGICGSCKCKVTKGDYTRTSTQTLTEEEIAAGFVLACSCQIEGDLEVALN